MRKRFYLATRKDRGEQAARLLRALKSQGWERTYSWTAEEGGTPEQYSGIAVKELKGVEEADVLIVLLPGGYGTHVEIGAALALGKPVILHAPDRKTLDSPYACPFHYHPNVKLLISEEIDIATFMKCLPD
jgi:nucleoside 2-deoxyribosyltransferase